MQTPLKSSFATFLLFLFQPEDSSPSAQRPSQQSPLSRFNTPLAGAVKIGFWMTAAVLFWTALPTACCLLGDVF